MMKRKSRNRLIFRLIEIIVLLLVIFIINLPYFFDIFYGKELIDKTLDNITDNLTNPDDIALSIMKWQKNFDSPYSLHGSNPVLEKFGIYEINGSYKWFNRNAPTSWIIYSRLANCGEHSRVFVDLMNKKGFNARILHAPGEDHSWAEYFSNGFKITVDPSSDRVVLDKNNYAKGKNWSYIESVSLFNLSDKQDVSDEYIERGNLTIVVKEKENFVRNIEIKIKSSYLMESKPDMYKKPKIVLIKKTDDNGSVSLKLGEKTYIIEVLKNYFLFDFVYIKNATIKTDENATINFNLAEDKKEVKFFNWFD